MINVPSLTQEEADAIVDEAHRRGIRTITHAYGGEGLRIMLKAGVDVPMHAADFAEVEPMSARKHDAAGDVDGDFQPRVPRAVAP